MLLWLRLLVQTRCATQRIRQHTCCASAASGPWDSASATEARPCRYSASACLSSASCFVAQGRLLKKHARHTCRLCFERFQSDSRTCKAPEQSLSSAQPTPAEAVAAEVAAALACIPGSPAGAVLAALAWQTPCKSQSLCIPALRAHAGPSINHFIAIHCWKQTRASRRGSSARRSPVCLRKVPMWSPQAKNLANSLLRPRSPVGGHRQCPSAHAKGEESLSPDSHGELS